MSDCNIKQNDLVYDLEKGLKAEEQALILCRKLAGLLEDSDDKHILEKIAEDEERHIKIVKRLIEVAKNFYQD